MVPYIGIEPRVGAPFNPRSVVQVPDLQGSRTSALDQPFFETSLRVRVDQTPQPVKLLI